MQVGDLVRIKSSSEAKLVGKYAIFLNQACYCNDVYRIRILDNSRTREYHKTNLEVIHESR